MRLIDIDDVALLKTVSDGGLSAKALWRRICKQPTVDAVPARHGNFVGTEYDGYADGYPVYYEWKCSECGCVFEDEEPTYKYCPDCGAKMVGMRIMRQKAGKEKKYDND